MYGKRILHFANKYLLAANINSLTYILQQQWLKQNQYLSYKDIPTDKLQSLNNYLKKQKLNIQNYIDSRIKNIKYKYWIYDVIKNKQQTLQDIPKLVLQLSQLQTIINSYNSLKNKFTDLQRKDFDIGNFKTHKEFHEFIQKYYQFAKNNEDRLKNKSKIPPFQKYYQNSDYILYTIFQEDQQDFKNIYGEKGWNTAWCVAQGTVDFNRYFEQFDYYVLITDKSYKPVALISLSDLQFKDVHDHSFYKLNDSLISIIDKLLQDNDIYIDEYQSDYNDFDGYFAYKVVQDSKESIDKDSMFEKVDKEGSLQIYQKSNDDYPNVYYFFTNQKLKLILFMQMQCNVYYSNDIDQKFVDDFFNFIVRKKHNLTYFTSSNIDLVKGFQLSKWLDFAVKYSQDNVVVQILSQSNKTKFESKQKALQYIVNKNEDDNDFSDVQKIYKETTDSMVKKYISKFYLTDQNKTNIQKKLKDCKSTQQLNNIFDDTCKMKVSDSDFNFFVKFLPYVQQLNLDNKKRLSYVIVENNYSKEKMVPIIKSIKDKQFFDLCVDILIQQMPQRAVYIFQMLNQEQQQIVVQKGIDSQIITHNTLIKKFCQNPSIFNNKFSKQIIDFITDRQENFGYDFLHSGYKFNDYQLNYLWSKLSKQIHSILEAFLCNKMKLTNEAKKYILDNTDDVQKIYLISIKNNWKLLQTDKFELQILQYLIDNKCKDKNLQDLFEDCKNLQMNNMLGQYYLNDNPDNIIIQAALSPNKKMNDQLKERYVQYLIDNDKDMLSQIIISRDQTNHSNYMNKLRKHFNLQNVSFS